MNRIEQIFGDLRQRRAKALMPFITVGDPDLETTAGALAAMQRAGAHICELGIPFSDPIADGPVIQASMTHALNRGLRPRQILEMVSEIRPRLEMGLVAMVSFSIVFRMGTLTFLKEAKQAGIDGLIFPDLPLDESAAVRELAAKEGLTCTLLIAPSTPTERAQAIARACTGFVYLIARAGITGERSALPADLAQRVAQIRQVTDLPVAVGFGVSTRQQVQEVVQVADAAIVGSAIMRRIAQHRDEGREAVVSAVESFVADLAGGLSVPDKTSH